MQTRLLIFFIILLSLWSVQAQSATTCSAATGDPIQIGAVFPQGALLTVNIAEAYQGAEAALETVNACGGVNNRPVEWLYIPANRRADAIAAAQDLVEDGITLIIGGGSQAVTEGLETASLNGDFVYWEVTETLSGESEWAFTSRPSNRQLGEAAAEFATTSFSETLNIPDLRVALVYEDRPRGEQIASGIRSTLTPVIELSYSDTLTIPYSLAERIRDEDIDLVMLGAFDDDADRLWFAMRQADANVSGLLQVGSAGYRRNLCDRFGNFDGFITVSPAGRISATYLTTVELYDTFRERYLRNNSSTASEQAMLSASGVYMLLHHVLPTVEGDYTAENIRQAILNVDIPAFSGFMGEGFSIADGVNSSPGVIIQQRQQGVFCTTWPDSIAMCAVEAFPTWRERALREESTTCTNPV